VRGCLSKKAREELSGLINDVGRGLHSFPFPLNLSLPCPFPLNLSLLRPHMTQLNLWMCPEGARVEL